MRAIDVLTFAFPPTLTSRQLFGLLVVWLVACAGLSLLWGRRR